MLSCLFQDVFAYAQRGHDVQSNGWLVKKYNLGIIDECSDQGDSLLVAGGECVEFPVEIALKSEHV